MIKFYCPNCSQKVGAHEGSQGKYVQCPKCNKRLRVPEINRSVEDVPIVPNDQGFSLSQALEEESKKKGSSQYSIVDEIKNNPPPVVIEKPIYSKPEQQGFFWPIVNLFNFDKMWTTIILKIIFKLLLVLLVIGGIFYIVKGEIPELVVLRIIISILGILFGTVLIRLSIESQIVFFQVNDTLTDIRDKR